jgi:plastocyanin
MAKACVVALLAVIGSGVHGGLALAANATVQTGFMPTVPTPTAFWTPSAVTVNVGDTVTFVNGAAGGGAPHSLVWADGAPGMAPAVPSTANSTPWTSARTFTAPGDYAFSCSFHVMFGMTGVVHVAAPATAPGPAASGPQPGPAPAAPADRTAPSLIATGTARRGVVSLRVRVGEAARITVVVRRGRRTVARRRYPRLISGRATLRLRVRARPGPVAVQITAADAAGNTTRRTLRLRLR